MGPGDDDHDVYEPAFLIKLQSIWGEGFLSPGGADAVAAIVRGLDLHGKAVLDIGSGLGGPSLLLAKEHGAATVLGIEIQSELVAGARAAARRAGLASVVEFRAVEPGPLPFTDGSFDLVFSKDSIIHVADKVALVAEIKRVLKPGGQVALSDWFGGKDPLSPEAEAWLEATGLTFSLKPIEVFARLFVDSGFEDVKKEDRNAWYVAQSRRDLEALKGDAGVRLAEALGREEAEEWRTRTSNRTLVAEQGHLRPGHVWARKPVG